MEDYRVKVKTQKSTLEKIMGYIPLYHGYKEKELRRESDKILRNFIFQISDKHSMGKYHPDKRSGCNPRCITSKLKFNSTKFTASKISHSTHPSGAKFLVVALIFPV